MRSGLGGMEASDEGSVKVCRDKAESALAAEDGERNWRKAQCFDGTREILSREAKWDGAWGVRWLRRVSVVMDSGMLPI
jgi:hypothetical protein